MRNVLDKSCRENQNTHFTLNFFSPQKSCRLTDNVEKKNGKARGATNDVTTWHIRVAYWISKATCTDAHSHKYVILIAFPRQQWLRERSSMLRCTYIVCFLRNGFTSKRLTAKKYTHGITHIIVKTYTVCVKHYTSQFLYWGFITIITNEWAAITAVDSSCTKL
jgi:hypothetical protein